MDGLRLPKPNQRKQKSTDFFVILEEQLMGKAKTPTAHELRRVQALSRLVLVGEIA